MTQTVILDWLQQTVTPTAHLCLDSREVQEGDVFFALPGQQADGRHYVDDAVARGAAAVVTQSGAAPLSHDVGVPLLAVRDLAAALGAVAHEWYGRPSDSLSVIAVTGTNGKTTTVQWIAAALNIDEAICGTIGTLGVRLPGGERLGGVLTTPDVLTMHRSLAALRAAGATVVAIEASSIGIHQGRLDHVSIDVAAFTNLTHDHLDYHGTLEQYSQAKTALFERPGLSGMVINLDDAAGAALARRYPEALTYSLGLHQHASIRADDIHTGSYGLIFNLSFDGRTAQLVSHVIGQHNISNLLLVAGVLRHQGWSIGKVARGLSSLTAVEGRLQVVEPVACGVPTAASPLVVVDYAHTPDALDHTLRALRAVAQVRNGKLVCVFGCGGNRDQAKRPQMGRIAAELADHVIVTSDNPRTENPASIIEQIVSGMPHAAASEPDRAIAILSAVWQAADNDVIVVAGKGHEDYQEIDGQRHAFDDRTWSRLALTWRGGVSLATDSRSLTPGQVFLAIQGESFDAHAFLQDVQEAGACAAVVARPSPELALPQFVVGDTQQALSKMGTAWRRRFALPVVAVAGSNGKTTTKEMIASIFEQWRGTEQTLATYGNFNNEIGVPLTLLRLQPEHSAAVIEVGMNHPGEIAGLADVAQPTVGVITNAQREHQEFMTSVDAVAVENGQILKALPENGVAVFPGDEAHTTLWRALAANRTTLTFGLTPECAIHARQIDVRADKTLCQLHTPSGQASLMLTAAGLHNLRNALAAAGAAIAAGAPLDAVVAGLEAFSAVPGRLQRWPLGGGWQLIDDTYNANPDSVRAAIDVLALLGGRKILILGDMAEVGNESPAVHAEVGAYAKERGIDSLLALGTASAHSVEAFGADAKLFTSIEPLVIHLSVLMPANVLVKGSRSARMERVVQALKEKSTAHEGGQVNAS